MHRDHFDWFSEDNFWRDETRAWEDETKVAEQGLQRLHVALQSHLERLRDHNASIFLKERIPAAHEHVLALQEKGSIGHCIGATQEQHGREGADHLEARQLHEQLKRKHYTIMARWNLILRALDDCQQSCQSIDKPVS
jgi:hypothetical protein